VIAQLALAAALFFDDFSQTDRAQLAAQGWTLREQPGHPGVPGARWAPEGLELLDDPAQPGNRLLRLHARTDGTPAGTVQAQLCRPLQFLWGTTSARVRFSPRVPNGDPVVQAVRPRLVVLLVVDGLPMRQVTDYRQQLAPDGLARFLDRGTWYADAHYGHAFTVTAAGHATMLTGAYSHRSGIIGNDWRDRFTGERIYCTGDTTATYIGHAAKPLDGTSPRNLQVDTVGDVLRRADPRSKVIGVSGKDRGAILPAGKTGTAYMYMSSSGQFASSTFYMPRHPEWVDRFNAAKPADRFFKAQWKPALDDAAYAQSLGDNQPWFGTRVGKLPMTYGASDDKPGPGFYGSLLVGPFADQLTLDFARAALAGEQLGQDEATDILSVSLSGHDYVNHAWSAESRLSHDHLLQLDRMLQGVQPADLAPTLARTLGLPPLAQAQGRVLPPAKQRRRAQTPPAHTAETHC
jgi:hypothetical protein